MKTTAEEAREKSHKETVKVLQKILEKNYDAEKGYTKAMKGATTPTLKAFLKQQAAQRSRFANTIDNRLRQLNEKPKEGGSTAGTMHRAWIDIKSSLTGNDDEAVLKEVIRGEKASVEEYQDVLKKHKFVPEITQELQTQLEDIQATLNEVTHIEDLKS
ncbi:PA2169 family four-helix-bundle protein [Subsaximicrobium wynnwilliamsii]|uniref:PA2169 family four-helix-bundle protein n=1 Tax=Subsaximicrobium wynnwilliamsii TaxID=291179 RepID=A0A5C6ZNV2_9FLAO|nr:PA2169 family four-helix-bundle protein [Subsaximicrobium wynnwilliamsii]TXD81642.1 PA2169 family four-helix-bundle protein [Subsaximicrobium wynnwilliamsii]TXD91031.1 PA2169 family four-helix-bundle protein [Subsaximicrobium wynnwilliamsii]TXE01090.1 PA2169 family four-helix-bundle protein [Subsaximicrobium wynnwilliamsii]